MVRISSLFFGIGVEEYCPDLKGPSIIKVCSQCLVIFYKFTESFMITYRAEGR